MRTRYVLIIMAVLASGLPAHAAGPGRPVKVSEDMIKQAAVLHQRETALNKREQALTEREKQLAELDRQLDEKLSRLLATQQEVAEKLAYIDSLKVRDKEFANLVKVYSAMSASKLAPLLNKMTDSDVAKILRAMKTDAVAKIIAKMEQDKAVRVSRLLGLMQ